MGANTYIGNAPNFMIKAIAEEDGIKMPGFFAYWLGDTDPVPGIYHRYPAVLYVGKGA